LPEWPLSRAERYHLALIAIEALNNILKHARATAVHLRLEIEGPAFKLSIIDNGRGFTNPEKPVAGHGLSNMRQRIGQLGGRFELTSSPGQGTVIIISLVPAALREAKIKS
jgi:signal transduction histidine kinase